jgi:hypothetical protein
MRRFSLKNLRPNGIWRSAGEQSLLAEAAGVPSFQELRPLFERELRRARRYERPLSLLVLALDTGSVATTGMPKLSAPDAMLATTVNGSVNENGHGTSNGNGNGHSGANGSGQAVETPRTEGLRTSNLSGSEPASPLAIYSAQISSLVLGALLRGTLRESDLVGVVPELQEYVAILPESDHFAAEQTAERINRLLVNRMISGLRAGVAMYPAAGLTLDDLVASAQHACRHEPVALGAINIP